MKNIGKLALFAGLAIMTTGRGVGKSHQAKQFYSRYEAVDGSKPTNRRKKEKLARKQKLKNQKR